MSDQGLQRHLTRLPRIVLHTLGFIGSILAILTAPAAVWLFVKPTSLLNLLIFIPSVIVAIFVILMPTLFFWQRLENVVEESWQDSWQRWQKMKEKMLSRH